MTRIIAGQARGRTLVVPRRGTRPTADRVRESMFATIDSDLHRTQREWADLAVADLYAGSGALGLEAMSRGAARVTLVEKARDAVEALRRNIANVLDAQRRPLAEVIAGDVAGWARTARPGAFDLVLIDPPYEVEAPVVDAIVCTLLERDAVRDDGLIVVERRVGGNDPLAEAASRHGIDVRQRRYGDTVLWYGRRGGQPGEPVKGE